MADDRHGARVGIADQRADLFDPWQRVVDAHPAAQNTQSGVPACARRHGLSAVDANEFERQALLHQPGLEKRGRRLGIGLENRDRLHRRDAGYACMTPTSVAQQRPEPGADRSLDAGRIQTDLGEQLGHVAMLDEVIGQTEQQQRLVDALPGK